MSFSIDKNHLLVHPDLAIENLIAQTAQKNNKTYIQSGGVLDTLIMHYTAGRNASSSAKYLAKPEVKASAHLVIGRNGEIYQLVPFDKVAWHAGVSKYGGRRGFNKYSIGIEMDNAGPLKKVGDKFKAWFGTEYPASEAIFATHRNETKPRYWQTYTEKQLKIVEEIADVIVRKYGLKHILGHEEIAPGRKQDPGPAFELDRFRDSILLGTNRASDEHISAKELPDKGKVDVSKLNIREGAGSRFSKIAKPLLQGQDVKILDEENGWYKVETKITGWVSKGYIDTNS